ncbi:hypothetical protein Q8F55_003239 [Vanrija albida]|uniref:Uncharacterized protein n=1 Tax=Vanrija albida TaxID=181172 RepID=A0ABR3QBZ5_9TREE
MTTTRSKKNAAASKAVANSLDSAEQDDTPELVHLNSPAPVDDEDLGTPSEAVSGPGTVRLDTPPMPPAPLPAPKPPIGYPCVQYTITPMRDDEQWDLTEEETQTLSRRLEAILEPASRLPGWACSPAEYEIKSVRRGRAQIVVRYPAYRAQAAGSSSTMSAVNAMYLGLQMQILSMVGDVLGCKSIKEDLTFPKAPPTT